MSDDPIPLAPPRVYIFVDFWNLSLGLNERHHGKFMLDWKALVPWLVSEAARVAGVPDASYRGMGVYGSYNPKREAKLKNWMLGWLDSQPGVQVVLKERRRKHPPKCPSCHNSVETCPDCGVPFEKTEEKGVDTAIATDMIRLAWENAYDIAVLVTSDADFIPAVEFLDQRGKRVIQAGLPPKGKHLATKCWGNFDLYAGHSHFERVKK